MVILPRTEPPSRSAIVLGLILGTLLSLETGQILTEAREFAPNLGGSRMGALRMKYWPESPRPRDDEPEPLADWLGLIRYLPEAGLAAEQEQAMHRLEQRASRAAAESLEGYTRLLEPLTAAQRRKLLEPQRRVADHRALGLDSAGQDLQVLWLHEMDLRAAGAKTVARAVEPAPDPWRLPPTRLTVSMRQLLDDPADPITPEQARAVLNRMVFLRDSLRTLHETHQDALEILTDDQLAGAKGRELRRWESLPSPQALEELGTLLEERRP